MECLKKAGLPLNTPMTVKSCDKNGWIVLVAGEQLIGSFIARLQNTAEVLALAVLTQRL